MSYELGILGAGNMAEAIARGAIDAGVLNVDGLIVADPSPERCAVFEQLGATVAPSNIDVIERAKRLLLAVKPQVFAKLGDQVRLIDPDKHLVISIMAGVSGGAILEAMGGRGRVIRVMPNTPLQVGQGASAVALAGGATDSDRAFALELFGAAGIAEVVDESAIDAVTALSGSGPAYVFYLAEAMTEAGEKLGLSPMLANKLARQTLLGASTLLVKSGEAASELRRRVTSPGGTTQAACEHLDAQSVKRHIIEAMAKAEARSKELGQ